MQRAVNSSDAKEGDTTTGYCGVCKRETTWVYFVTCGAVGSARLWHEANSVTHNTLITTTNNERIEDATHRT